MVNETQKKMKNASDELSDICEKINIYRFQNEVPPSELTIRATELSMMISMYFSV